MHFQLLLIVLTLAVFAAAALLGSVATRAVWTFWQESVARSAPRPRAHLLFALRCLPSAAGLVCASGAAGAFLRHEPRHTTELPGLVLLLAGAAGAALVVGVVTRAARGAQRALWFARLARYCRQATIAGGTTVYVVDTRYPVAAVLGIFKPRLLLSSRILTECTPEEVEAIVAHERAHVRHNDNLLRSAMVAMADPLGRLGAGSPIERAWGLATEQAADGDATGSDEHRRAVLAQALVRVARMAEGAPPAWMPALAFYQGYHLGQRVQTLLELPAPEAVTSRRLLAGVGALATIMAVFTANNLSTLHAGLEWIVRSLP